MTYTWKDANWEGCATAGPTDVQVCYDMATHLAAVTTAEQKAAKRRLESLNNQAYERRLRESRQSGKTMFTR